MFKLKVYDDSFPVPEWIFNETWPNNSYSTIDEAEHAKHWYQGEYDGWRAEREKMTMEEYYSAEAAGKITTANIIIVDENGVQI